MYAHRTIKVAVAKIQLDNNENPSYVQSLYSLEAFVQVALRKPIGEVVHFDGIHPRCFHLVLKYYSSV